MKAGAKGYITKNSAPGILITAIQKIGPGSNQGNSLFIDRGMTLYPGFAEGG